MNDIYEIIGKILAAAFVALIAYLTPHVKAWLQTHADKSEIEALESLISSFAQAAEQLWHDTDETGEVRMNYVKAQLTELGYKITDEVTAMIEGSVWKINTENRKAGPKDNPYEDIEDGGEYDYDND